jgi:hypothetical protein
MSLLLRVPIDLIELPVGHDTLSDAGFVYEDLRFFHSLAGMVPHPRAVVAEEKITITSGLRYALIARDLGFPEITLLVPSDSDVGSLIDDPRVVLSPVPDEPDEMYASGVDDRWHVTGFLSRLAPTQRSSFENEMRSLFLSSAISGAHAFDITFVDTDVTLAYFRAATPLEDHSFLLRLMKSLGEFHDQTASIRSYQGKVFESAS